MANRYAVIINSQAPSDFFALVKDYLRTHDPEMKFLLCSKVEQDGSFLACELIQNESHKLWHIQIPIGFVVAIADLEKDQTPIGFLADIK